MFKVKGTVRVVRETVQVNEKFSKREFVLTTEKDSKYPQDVSFELKQDKCNLLDGISEGEAVEVSFNLRGRAWTNPQGEQKFFNTLEAWKIESESPATPVKAILLDTPSIPEDDDLPF